MNRNKDIKISFDATNFSQIFIHTSGAYLSKPITPNNNKYLANYKTSDELKALVLEINNTSSKSKREKLIKDLMITLKN